MNRIILHCDLNNFFASVECRLDPSLRGRPVAVCGNTEERHGIVLAKNIIAKSFGVSTGEAVFQAQKKCAGLAIVPPHYDEYVKYSERVRDIYARYTDMIEPFGIDECWLDVTGSTMLFGDGYQIAWKIKEAVKREVGITLSVGVSFNKIFAKLGSDLKKPDAVTCIDADNFKERIWKLPASEMMGVGRKTTVQLHRRLINTIGDLAKCDPKLLEFWFGKCGLIMWIYANGLDNTPVMKRDFTPPIKSVGHGLTTTSDLETNEEVSDIFIELSQVIGSKLRSSNLSATGVAIAVRDNKLVYKEYQCRLPYSTQSSRVISGRAVELFKRSYDWHENIRSVTVRAISLVPGGTPQQLNIFSDCTKQLKLEKLDVAVDKIREKYGPHAVTSATYLKKDIKLVRNKPLSETPITMFM